MTFNEWLEREYGHLRPTQRVLARMEAAWNGAKQSKDVTKQDIRNVLHDTMAKNPQYELVINEIADAFYEFFNRR